MNTPSALILNVDDNDGARYAKSRTLARAGFKVVDAASGTEALSLARSLTPDLILLDTKLPDINGFEVCSRLKADQATQIILILQTSASYLKPSDKVHAINGGADNYLFEPIEPEELVANVKALLRLGRVERELREVGHRKDEFLATLGHELRNPLGPIRNAAQLLRRLSPDLTPMQDKAHQIIMRQTDHIIRLVDDLLDVSRISQGKIIIKNESVDLRSFIDHALETSEAMIGARGHQLRVTLPEHAVRIRGDAVRLAQIVGNLLHNAAKFTPQGGQIELDAELDGAWLCLRVSDNGIGIAPENLHFIFDLFAQDGHSSDRFQDGLGVGLALVRKLVELHGGTVGARSAGVGLGSTFEVRLPLGETMASPDAQPAPDAVQDAQAAPLHILIIDDNEDAAEMLGELLETAHQTVRIAHNGGDGLELAGQRRPDVVFLDIGLPDMSGYEVALKLRELDGMGEARLIALTGFGRPEDASRAQQAGFHTHLVKPLDLSRLQGLGLQVALD